MHRIRLKEARWCFHSQRPCGRTLELYDANLEGAGLRAAHTLVVLAQGGDPQ